MQLPWQIGHSTNREYKRVSRCSGDLQSSIFSHRTIDDGDDDANDFKSGRTMATVCEM